MKTSLSLIAGLALTMQVNAATINLLEEAPLATETEIGISWINGNRGSGWTDDIGKPGLCTAEELQACLTANTSLGKMSGWQASVSNLSSAASVDIYNVTENGFGFKGRKGYGGEFVLFTYFADSGVLLSNISISGSANASSFGAELFGVLEDDTISLLSTVSTSGDFLLTSTEEESYKAVYAVFQSNSTGEANTVSNLVMTAEAQSVPEPATASMGALGLAALMIRRRREKNIH